MIFRRLLLAAAALAATAAAAAIAMVALSYALFALARGYVGSSGAAAIVALVYAVLVAIGALFAGRAAMPPSRRASERQAVGVIDRLTEVARERPVTAAGVALALGIVLMRSPKSLAAVASAGFDSLTGRTRPRR